MSTSETTPRATGTRFIERILESIELLGATRKRVVVAVSGGPDSTALVVALHSLQRQKKLDVAAAHANHALRGDESDGDERFVRELCDRLKTPLVCRRLPVPVDATDRDEGIEATARHLRLQLYVDAARALDAPFVATAHTTDDQAETVLQRIVRGTGLAGLAGIPVERSLAPDVTLIRPLMQLRRADVLEYLSTIGQSFREDRSNLNRAFLRNRLRLELIPYLEEHVNPHATAALARLAMLAGDAQAVIDLHVDRLLRRAIIAQDAERVIIRTSALRRASRFVLCEFLRRIWNQNAWPMQQVGYEDFVRLAQVLRRQAPGSDLPGGVRVTQTRDRIILDRSRGLSES